MRVSFDLISDLHVETWPEPFDWKGMQTSTVALVAGDISRDRNIVLETLYHLGTCYNAVIYIDGNDEHRYHLENLFASYEDLHAEIKKLPNVLCLQDNVVVVDGVGFVGVNGWWHFDFDESQSYNQSRQWWLDHYKVQEHAALSVEAMAMQDAQYLCSSVQKLQTQQDVDALVVCTHTVPSVDLIKHDIELEGSHRLNCMGNSHIKKCLHHDTERKIQAWCFGHYHNDIDLTLDGVRYVNNCRGRGDTKWSKSVYNPKKIVIDF